MKTPATYPARGAWRFRNVTKAADFWPLLDSIGIDQQHPEGVASFSADVEDADLSQTFEPEDRVWVTFTKAGGSVRRVFAGHLKVVTERMLSEMGPRVWALEAQDHTAKLDDSVIDHPADRAKETNAARVAWILGFLNFGITTASVSVPAGNAEKANFDGQTVREALDQFCEEADAHYYLDFGPEDPTAGNVPDLHLFADEVLSAPFALNDTDPDYAADFPFTEYERTKDSGDLTTAIYVQGETGIAWVADPGRIATYGRQERTLADSNLKTADAMAKAAAQMLVKDGDPTIEGSLVCWEPGLRAGMKTSLTVDLWGLSAVTVILTSIRISAVDPHDADGRAFLRTDVDFTDRRRLKGRGRRPPKGDTGDDSGTTDGTDGASLTVSAIQSVHDSLTHDAWAGLFSAGAPYVGSWISQNTAYTTAGCPMGGGLWGPGGQTWEAWYTVDASGTDGILGARATIHALGTLKGVGDPGEYDVGWANAAPSGLGQWRYLGTIPGAGGDVYVPGGLIIDGGTNYLVLAPAWVATSGWSACGNYIADDFGGPITGGEGNSGRGIASGAANQSVVSLVTSGAGKTSWVSPAGSGDADGTNDTWTLPGWNGKGIPEARWGVVILGLGLDYAVDAGAGTVTFHEPPPADTLVAFRYRTDG